MQMGVEAIRNEVLKVLQEDETFQELQQDLSRERRSNTGLRRRLPASRSVRSAGDDASEALDDPDVHMDTWTEPSSSPGSPRSDQEKPNDTLDLCSDWDGSDFELLPGPSSSERDDTALQVLPGGSGKESMGHRIAQWLQSCSKSIARVVGGVCQGAVALARSVSNDCTKLLKDVASWCQRSIDALSRQSMHPCF